MSGRSVSKCLEMYTKGVNIIQSQEKTMDEIRNHLIKFAGGSVELQKVDSVAVVTLKNEAKRNAISGKMMVELHDVVEELATWQEGKAVLLRGSSGTFCSGGDLDFAKRTATPEEGLMMSTFMHEVLGKLHTLPLLSVALIEGAGAIGGGAEVCVACDFRLATATCKGVGFVHPRMGIVPAWGGTHRLVHTVGYRKALHVLTSGRVLSPQECLAIGLVDEVIPADDATVAAMAWLEERTSHGAGVTRGIKACAAIARDFPSETELQRRIFAPFWGSPANLEAHRKNIKH